MTARSTVVREIHERVWAAVGHRWAPNAIFGHGTDHAERAYAHGMRLAAAEGADQLPVGVACYLMDAGLDITAGRLNHVARSMALATEVCDAIPELDLVRDAVLAGVRFHEADDPLPPGQPVEVLVVRDSDTLDRMGLTGVRMTLTYGTWIGRPLCHPKDPLCEYRTPELDQYTVDYLRYLYTLQTILSTPSGRAFGDRKLTEQETYLEAFRTLCGRSGGKPDYPAAFALVEEQFAQLGEH